MIRKKPSIQYIWEFPLTIKINTIKQSGRVTFWSKREESLIQKENRFKKHACKIKQNWKGFYVFYQHNGHTVGVAQVCQPHFNVAPFMRLFQN